jgi:hypothetical protein
VARNLAAIKSSHNFESNGQKISDMAGIGSAFGAFAQARKPGGMVDPGALIRALFFLYGGLIQLAITIAPAFRALIANLIWNNMCLTI